LADLADCNGFDFQGGGFRYTETSPKANKVLGWFVRLAPSLRLFSRRIDAIRVNPPNPCKSALDSFNAFLVTPFSNAVAEKSNSGVEDVSVCDAVKHNGVRPH
jgi:hypothetical protein